MELKKIETKDIPDEDPDISYLEGERLQQYNAGEFSYIGIQAQAEVVICGVCQTITSSGLWGIESDSSNDYLEIVQDEQEDELGKILLEMGFTKEQIETAVKEC